MDNKLEITLHLQDIDHLFNEPDFTPFSEYYEVYSFKNGMDYVVGEMYANPSADEIELTVVLPPEQITPGLEQRTIDAIGKYSAAWAYDAQQDIDKERYQGIRAAIVGVLGFLLLAVVGNVLIDNSNELVEALGEGLLVAGWVLLWWPLESIFFGLWGHRLERSAYRTLQNIQLSILPDGRSPQ